ncbi:MAG: hypothetical protein WC655_12765, partial [Candidatus Hydrogenedentales bacterium]
MKLPGIPQRLRPPWAFMALVRRHVYIEAKKKGQFLILSIILIAAWGILYLTWPADEVTYSMAANNGKLVSCGIGLAVLFALIGIVPLMAAQSLIEERLKNTHDLLRLTPITPTGIIAGLLLNSFVSYSVLIISFMPLLAIAAFVFPLDLSPLMVPLIVVPASAIASGIGAVAFSATATDPRQASQRSMAWTTFCVVAYPLVPLAVMMFSGRRPQELASLAKTLFATTPAVLSVKSIIGPDPLETTAASLGIQILLATLAYVVAYRTFSRPTPDLVVPAAKPQFQIFGSSRTSLVQARPNRRMARPIPDRWNPILVYELRHSTFTEGLSGPNIVIVALVLLVSNLAFASMAFSGDGMEFRGPEEFVIVGWMAALSLVAVLAVGPVSASVFTKELERGTKDLLQLTLATPSQLVLGKALGGVYHAFLASALVAASNLPALVG